MNLVLGSAGRFRRVAEIVVSMGCKYTVKFRRMLNRPRCRRLGNVWKQDGTTGRRGGMIQEVKPSDGWDK